MLTAILIACLVGCRTRGPVAYEMEQTVPMGQDGTEWLPKPTSWVADVQPASFMPKAPMRPPRVRDIHALTPWPMSLDEAIRIALENSPVIRSAGGQTLGTTFDPALFATDPNLGPAAALAAFDTQLKSSLTYRGGGNALSSGAFGVFSQPTNTAELGVARIFRNGTRARLGVLGGYDQDIAGGAFGAFGAEVRHPLQQGAGTEINMIAGPGGNRGIWITQLDSQKVDLDLEQAVRDLVRDVAISYWTLYFSYHDLNAKQAALEVARQTWHLEQTRVAEQASPPDVEAAARQQYYTADAAVQNAIGGSGPAGTGVYGAEAKLRTLLALPTADGSLIQPTARPLEAELHFDWDEALHLAHSRRVELRKQRIDIEKRKLELKVSQNLRRPKVDLVGQYRGPVSDPGNRDAMFSSALQTWNVGIEFSKVLGDRREDAAVRNSELRLSRDRALQAEQEQQLTTQLQSAFTELDRAYGVTQSLGSGLDAAKVRLQAELERHAVGDALITNVLDAQIRATQAETAMLRSLVDYNLAIINLHYVRGTMLETLGVGFLSQASEEQISFAKNHPSIFAENSRR
ncbi:MAG: TolC family protein [Planctomycetales bacterium]|nr:TolC family protein [Planctomycetales bacterium]